MNFDRYFTNSELDELLRGWEGGEYKNLYRLSEIGRSHEGRPLWLATITNVDTGPHDSKPAIWFDANIHSTEIAGTTAIVALIHRLLSGYGKDEEITGILDTAAFYLMPRVNPDGVELALAARPRYLRSGVRPYPWDEKDSGIHPEDIDGDGRILQMRIPDPSGDWKLSEFDPRLMQKRRPNENGGSYYRLFPEGLIEDFDGYIIKPARAREGLDFNRNFPGNWRPEGEQTGAGPYPTSEPEIRAMVDFITRHPNINIAVTYHTFSGVILRPFSTRKDEEMETDDLWVYEQLGRIGNEITEYPCVSVFHDFKYHPKEVITGTFDDWLYDHSGVIGFTVELWDLAKRAGIEDRKFIEWFRDHPHEEDAKILRWLDEHGEGDSYVSWYPFKHPQLGEIELGGWNKMFSWRNPPRKFMGEEAARNVSFALALSSTLPALSVHALNISELEPELFRIELVVENTGFLPTDTSRQARKRKAAREVRALLGLPEGATLVSGKEKVKLGHLEGRSNKLSVSAFGWTSSQTDNRARCEWVVRSRPGVKLTLNIESDRAGKITRFIELNPAKV